VYLKEVYFSGLSVNVGDNLKIPASKTTKPAMGTHINLTSSTVSYLALSSEQRAGQQSQQSVSNVFNDFNQGDKIPETVTIDNRLSPVAAAVKNKLPSHWSIITSVSSSSPTEAASSSTFPLVGVDDDVTVGSDTDWETVNELLREVGHQLAGLRSFIRRVRVDNSAVYRDIMQTVLRVNRVNTATGMVQCIDSDDDEEEEEEEDDNEDDDLQQEPVHSPSQQVLRQLAGGDNDKTDKRTSSGTAGE